MQLNHAQIASSVEKLVIAGIKKANSDYERLSGGEWVSERGVESFIAGRVAYEIRKSRTLPVKYIILEAGLSEVTQYYLPRGFTRGRKGRALAPKNRIDLVAVDLNDCVIGVVELKRNRFIGDWIKDVGRVADLTKRGRDIMFGCFAGFVAEQKGGAALIKGTAEEIHSEAQKQGERKKLELKTFYGRRPNWTRFDDEYWRYGVVGCVFTKGA